MTAITAPPIAARRRLPTIRGALRITRPGAAAAVAAITMLVGIIAAGAAPMVAIRIIGWAMVANGVRLLGRTARP